MKVIQRLLYTLIPLAIHSSSSRRAKCEQKGLEECKCDSEGKVIDCREKKMSKIPSTIPETVTSLYLSSNNIKKIEQIGDLTNLIYLNLDSNQIDSIQFDVFDNMDSLQRLVLSNNNLSSLDDDTFEWNPLRLEIIDLSFNKFKYIQHFLFYDLERLQEIYLQKNIISFIHPHAFQQLKELRKLDLSGNHLKTFNPQWVQKLAANAMETMNFSGNRWACDCGMTDAIKFLQSEDAFWFTDLVKKDGLYCTDANGKSNGKSVAKQTIKSLTCNPPRITGISKPSEISAGRSVLLRCQATGSPEPTISWIAPNEDVYRLNSDNFKGVNVDENGDLLIQNLKKSDEGKYICQASSNTGDQKNNVVQVSTTVTVKAASETKQGRYDGETESIDASDDEKHEIFDTSKHCPKGCTCLAEQIDCSYPQQDGEGGFSQKMDSFPSIPRDDTVLSKITQLYNLEGNSIDQIPADVCGPFDTLHELRLNDNEISEIDEDAFEGCQDLKVLTLRKNFLSEIPTETFQDMPKLEILVLDENEIMMIGANSFNNLPSLRWIYLRNNKIRQINEMAFNRLPRLDFMHLEENYLSHLQVNWMDHLRADQKKHAVKSKSERGEVKLFLDENPVRCDCNLREFYNKAKKEYGEMIDMEEIVCDSPAQFRDKMLDELTDDDLKKCSDEPDLIGVYDPVEEESSGTLHLILGVLLGLMVSVGGVYVYNRHRRGQLIEGWRDVAYRDISGGPSEQVNTYPGADETQALTQNQPGNATEAYI